MNHVYLRKADYNDSDLLFHWANDPVVRANSFNSDPIPYDTHVAWFLSMMERENVLQYILMDENVPVGQIRLIIDSDEAEIGYSIASEFRGKGYGRKILKLIVEKVHDSYPGIKKLIAKVKPENAASKKLFESEGYEMKYACYSLKIPGGGYYELSNFNDFRAHDAIFLADIYERRIA